jgi:hypothetical protein
MCFRTLHNRRENYGDERHSIRCVKDGYPSHAAGGLQMEWHYVERY